MTGPAHEPLTPELVLARLRSLRDEEAPADAAAPAADPYVIAAALRSTFEPESLPVPGATSGEAIGPLLDRSIVVEDGAGDLRWSLRTDARREAFAALGDREHILAACHEYSEPGDRLQEALIAQLDGSARPLSEQGIEELAQTLQVTEWLSGIVESVDDPAAVRHRLDRLLLSEPFRYLAGEHFSGRKEDLRKLSDYVGVLEPGSKREWGRRTVRGIFRITAKPPLVVWGVGGIGKSTLLARFMLDHSDAEEAALAFAYLDFDRSAVQAEDPASLLIEAARQLAVQSPNGPAEWDRLRQDWAGRTLDVTSARTIKQASAPQRFADESAQHDVIRHFSELFDRSFPDATLLLVLDTFEEIQYRSRAFVDSLWDFFDELQDELGRVRTVIAGRAPVEGHDTTRPLELQELDAPAAAAYLRSRGIDDERTSRFIVSRLGGNPLTLRLAADIVEQDDDGVDTLRSVKGRHRLLRMISAGQETIQRALYKRILDHIHDDEVRRLAHPGLTLRRVTPDLIASVLADPCGVPVESDADAERLMEALRREVSLVRPAEEGGVEHRPDLRRLMLPMLNADQPARVKDIHDRAVEYYGRRSTPADRAEEIYHRLARGDDPRMVEERWMPGVERYLRGAVAELPASAQAFLAPLVEVELDDDTWKQASQRDRERRVERQARDLIGLGRYKEALEQLRAVDGPPSGGPLDVLAATALHQLGRYEEALATIDHSLEALRPDAEARIVLEQQELAARIEQDQGHLAPAAERLQEAYPIARWLGEQGPVLTLGVRWLGLLRQTDPDRVPEVAGQVHEELERLVSDDLLMADPELAWALAGQLGDAHPDAIRRVARAVAFPLDLPPEGVNDALATWAQETDDPDVQRTIPRDETFSTRRALSAFYTLFATREPPPKTAAALARLLRDRQPSRDLR